MNMLKVLPLAAAIALAGCATAQRPVLYPNAHLKNVGDAAAAGAAVGGTAGAVHGAFQDNANPTYRNFVQRCLGDRGYDVIGWR